MIKFLDLHKLNARFGDEFKMEFQNFLDSGFYVLGEQVALFEKAFADYCGTKYCIGVSNGLDALKLIFEGYKALGVLNEGDEVLVPANTYIATVLAVSACRLKPILVEPNICDFNIDKNEVLKYITKKTKAILGVHLYGGLYNVEGLEKIAKDYNLLLIEDAAQAHGAVNIDGRKAGNVSNVAAFSFYPTKNLGALGDAGAITTNNSDLAAVLYKLRNYGRTTSYENDYKGFNCRLDELQAAFLRIKLKYLDSDNNRRRELALKYFNGIVENKVILPVCENLESHVFHLFVILCESREELKGYLLKNGIETSIHYPVPIHKQEAYKELKHCEFAVTERIHKEVLSLPLNPILMNEEVYRVIDVLNKY